MEYQRDNAVDAVPTTLYMAIVVNCLVVVLGPGRITNLMGNLMVSPAICSSNHIHLDIVYIVI